MEMDTRSITIAKENKMSETVLNGLKALVGKKVTRKVKFMGQDVEISKLSVSDVKEIQEIAQQLNAEGVSDETKEELNFQLIRTTVRAAVEGGTELEDDDFKTFPMDELSSLMDQVFKFSGLGADKGK